MCIILIEAQTALSRLSCMKIYKNIARSRLFSRIAKSLLWTRMEGRIVLLPSRKEFESNDVMDAFRRIFECAQ